MVRPPRDIRVRGLGATPLRFSPPDPLEDKFSGLRHPKATVRIVAVADLKRTLSVATDDGKKSRILTALERHRSGEEDSHVRRAIAAVLKDAFVNHIKTGGLRDRARAAQGLAVLVPDLEASQRSEVALLLKATLSYYKKGAGNKYVTTLHDAIAIIGPPPPPAVKRDDSAGGSADTSQALRAVVKGRHDLSRDEVEGTIRLDRDRKRELRRGPYFKAGLLVHYWRDRAGLNQSDVGPELLTRFKFRDYSEFEAGWKECRDPAVLECLAEKLGIPPRRRRPFLLYLTNIYDEVDKIRCRFSPKGLATDFPNREWDIPHIWRSREEIRESIVRIIHGEWKGSRLRREDFAKRVGFSRRQLDAAKYTGNLGADSLIHFITSLRADGKEKDAMDVRMLRAAAGVVCSPVSRENALQEAALLLRFARFLVPIFNEEVIFKLLGWEGALNVYKESERGMARMPPDLLGRFASLMVKEGIFNEKQESSFIRRIESIYGALSL